VTQPPPRSPDDPQEAASRRVYASAALVDDYAGRPLKPVEEGVLAELRPSLEGARVLELGCGAGAITRQLLQSTDRVVGVDVSPAMVEYCRRTFPAGEFRVADLRDLTPFAAGSFDVVVAGDNLVDVLTHDERPRVLKDIRRLLADGGLFYFSTHNRNSREALEASRRGPRLRRERHPYRQLRALAGFVQGRLNHRRLRHHQLLEADWAILNDPAHRWALLHHYISRGAEAEELAACGFELLSVRGVDGPPLEPSDDDGGFWDLHYVARARS
jgi:SAM-dependent methyltransferase